jgi:hypothetical protein
MFVDVSVMSERQYQASIQRKTAMLTNISWSKSRVTMSLVVAAQKLS